MSKSKFYQRPDGLYETIRSIKGHRVAFRGHSVREVEQKMLAYREDINRGRPFPIVADEWERTHAAEVVDATRYAYAPSVRRLKAAFPGRVGEIQPLDLVRYIKAFEGQGRAAASVDLELSVLRMIFAHAVNHGDISVSPAAEVHRSRGLPRKTRQALTEAQEAAVIASWENAPFGLFGLFLLYTGMRRGEALAVSYADIDRTAGVIHVTKKLSYTGHNYPVMQRYTKSINGIRDVPLLPPLAYALPVDRAGLLFPGKRGFMTGSEIEGAWKRYCRAAGLNHIEISDQGERLETFPITPHCFRHSFATICYEAGLDPRQAARILGDTPEVVEKVYTHLREGRRLTAAEKLVSYFSGVG